MQIIVISQNELILYAYGSRSFNAVLRSPCHVGKNGLTYNKTEGDLCTPKGVFNIQTAFGIAPNPGTSLKYINIGQNTYLVDDPRSKYYNKIIEKDESIDFRSGEHMIEFEKEYLYGMVIDHNPKCIKDKGSGIFLHCGEYYTRGCVAVPKRVMKELLIRADKNTIIVI